MEIFKMKIVNLENAKKSLLDAYLELEDAEEPSDSDTSDSDNTSESQLAYQIANHKQNIMGIIGSLELKVARLKKMSDDVV